MITLSDVSNFAAIHNLSPSTDIFMVLAQMNLAVIKPSPAKTTFPCEDAVEWTFEQTLNLFSS